MKKVSMVLFISIMLLTGCESASVKNTDSKTAVTTDLKENRKREEKVVIPADLPKPGDKRAITNQKMPVWLGNKEIVKKSKAIISESKVFSSETFAYDRAQKDGIGDYALKNGLAAMKLAKVLDKYTEGYEIYSEKGKWEPQYKCILLIGTEEDRKAMGFKSE